MLLAGKKRKTYSTKGMKSKDESLQYRLLASYSILQFLKGEHTQPLTRPSLQPAREAGIDHLSRIPHALLAKMYTHTMLSFVVVER